MKFLNQVGLIAVLLLQSAAVAYAGSTCPSTGGGLCNGLVAYWKMDEADPTGTSFLTRHDETRCHNDLLDASDDLPPYSPEGKNIDGVKTGVDRFGNANGATKCAQAVPWVPGDACHLEIASNLSLETSAGDFTVAAWLTRRGPLLSVGHDVWKGFTGNGGPIHDWAIEIQGTGDGVLPKPHVHFVVFDEFMENSKVKALGTHLTGFDPGTVPENDFFLAVGTYDRNHGTVTLTIKYKGTTHTSSQTDSTGTFVHASHLIAPVGIGGKGTGNKGVDDVMIWRDRTLSQDEINRLYKRGLGCAP